MPRPITWCAGILARRVERCFRSDHRQHPPTDEVLDDRLRSLIRVEGGRNLARTDVRLDLARQRVSRSIPGTDVRCNQWRSGFASR